LARRILAQREKFCAMKRIVRTENGHLAGLGLDVDG
jgi:hypothetical protein